MDELQPAGAPVVLVYSEQHLIAQGLVGLLPESLRPQAVIVDGVGDVEERPWGSFSATVIDAEAADAERVAVATRTLGASVIVLLASAGAPLGPGLRDDADAVLIRDDVEPRMLRLALVAGRAGMRLLPRALPVFTAPAAPVPSPLGEPAQRALELLADGMRDAEIALELNLSESAVRKLIQRAVRRAGARTRCQAVAAAVRGELN